ncbi:hypothetical protein E3Q17_04024 [Wallemia mellicola]|uniref:Uncharacterized protein n=1 Tax=Wallemia mellicola TaxID=1708541 RepID=A0A4T0NGM4_9BASI|nr:hypothetical protein E3Q21_03102 [Wallemia mellicola]TIB85831.1 hypothetical protein E3Q20_03093 [Wallemia mellicola]TIB96085.1 hypothetical protein E3Q17_04024 [Wallemia mellicola]TIC21943.1 hypothetical protein E3Q12_03046 [Wallemia mellicola]TIC34099.1 hypothetical protein E3Q09_03167 [Wallemia mellicola]
MPNSIITRAQTIATSWKKQFSKIFKHSSKASTPATRISADKATVLIPIPSEVPQIETKSDLQSEIQSEDSFSFEKASICTSTTRSSAKYSIVEGLDDAYVYSVSIIVNYDETRRVSTSLKPSLKGKGSFSSNNKSVRFTEINEECLIDYSEDMDDDFDEDILDLVLFGEDGT